MIRTVEGAVERQATRSRIEQTASTRPPTHCPVHPEHALEGGPVRFRCPLNHSVPAADIDHEYKPRTEATS